jgi:hypothetical protein
MDADITVSGEIAVVPRPPKRQHHAATYGEGVLIDKLSNDLKVKMFISAFEARFLEYLTPRRCYCDGILIA